MRMFHLAATWKTSEFVFHASAKFRQHSAKGLYATAFAQDSLSTRNDLTTLKENTELMWYKNTK